MAKALLVKILVDVLGQYVENLSAENLKLGIWSGEFELYDLQLKSSALDKLNLPVKVCRGSLKALKVRIPWASLGKTPIHVEISGIYLLAKPVDTSAIPVEELVKIFHEEKMKKIKELEDSIMNSFQSFDLKETAKTASYFQQLAVTIVNNLEISITNIHIRYEDTYSVPNTVIAAGITIYSITLATTDPNWKKAFVSGNTELGNIIYKLGVMQNLSVYWNCSSDEFDRKEYSATQWEKLMEDFIYGPYDVDKEGSFSLKENNSGIEYYKIQYLLHPHNKQSLKMVYRENPSPLEPKIFLTVENSTTPFSIDQLQYQQAMTVAQTFGQLTNKKRMALYRPANRPTAGKKSAREWWYYAYRLVSGRDLTAESKFQTMVRCLRARKPYIALVVKKRLSEGIGKEITQNKDEIAVFPPLISSENLRLEEYERTLPITALLSFHQKAVAEVKSRENKIRSEHMKQQKEAKENQSWLGWAFGGTTTPKITADLVMKADNYSTNELAEDDQLLQKLESNLHSMHATAEKVSDEFSVLSESTDARKIPQQYLLHFSMKSTSSVSLTYQQSPLIFVKTDMVISADIKSDEIQMDFELKDLKVKDQCTDNPANELIVSSFKDSFLNDDQIDEKLAQFTTKVKTGLEGTNVEISSYPLTIVYNEACIQRLMAFLLVKGSFSVSGIESIVIDPKLLANINKFAQDASLPKKQTTIDIKLQSPKIVFPENSQDLSSACLIVETGNLSLSGCLNSEGMNFDIALQAISISTPPSLNEHVEKSRSRSTSLIEFDRHLSSIYLLKPFDIKVGFNNTQQSIADMIVDITLTPEISAEIDDLKVMRILTLMRIILNSVDISSYQYTQKQIADQSYVKSVESGASAQEIDVLQYSSNVSHPTGDSTNSKGNKSVDKVDPKLKKIKLSLSIPSVSAMLVLNKSKDQHFMTFALNNMALEFIQRPYDMNVEFTLQGLSVFDSYRPDNHQYIVWTDADTSESKIYANAEEDSFVSLQLYMANDSSSPSYDGYSMEVVTKFRRLSIGIDDSAIYRLEPFASKIMNHLRTFQKTAVVNPAAYNNTSGLFPNSAETIPINASKLSMQSRSVKGREHNHNIKTDGENPFSMKASLEFVSLSVHLMSELSVVDKTELVDLFVLELNNFNAMTSLQQLKNIVVSLKDITITEMRRESINYFYKQIFAKSKIGSQYTSSNKNQLVLVNSIDAPLIQLDLHDKSESRTEISLVVRESTIFLSIEIISNLIASINSLAAASTSLVSSISDNSDKTDEVPITEIMPINNAQSSNNEKQAQVAVIKLEVVNPRVLLLADPSRADTQAIIIDCDIAFNYTRDCKDVFKQDTYDFIQGSLSGIEFIIVSSLQDGDAEQLIRPFSIDGRFNRRMEQGVVLKQDASISVGDVLVCLSITDILVIRNVLEIVLQTNNNSGLQSNSQQLKAVKSSEESSSPSHATKSETSEINDNNISVFTAYMKSPMVKITLIDDSKNPLLRSSVVDLEFSVSGSQRDLNGSGGLTVGIDYFNYAGCAWEPAFEAWTPKLLVKTDDHTGFDFEISSTETLQLNVSGKLLSCIYNTQMLLSRPEEEIPRNLKRSLDSSITRINFKNQLGLPVIIRDSTSKEILLDLDDNSLVALQSSFGSGSRDPADDYADAIEKLSNYVDLEFKGKLREVRYSLYQLPLNIHRPLTNPLSSKPGVHESSSLLPLSIVWDIKINSDYSRSVFIRTRKQVCSNFPMPVEIELTDFSTEAVDLLAYCGLPTSTILTVDPSETVNIPLLYLNAKSIRVRPKAVGDQPPFEWFHKISFQLKELSDKTMPIDIAAMSFPSTDRSTGGIFYGINCFDEENSLVLRITPNYAFHNHLLCNMHLEVGSPTHDERRESATIKAGKFYCCKRLNNYKQELPIFHLYIGKYRTINPVLLAKHSNNIGAIDANVVLENENDRDDRLVLYYKSFLDKSATVNIILYAKYLLVDHCFQVKAAVRSAILERRNLGQGGYVDKLKTCRLTANPMSENDIEVDSNVDKKALKKLSSTIASNAWVNGNNGLTIFHCDDGKLKLGVNNGAGWIKDVPIFELENRRGKSPLEIEDPSTQIGYQVALKVDSMAGLYNDTQIVNIIPKYNIINATDCFVSMIQENFVYDTVDFVDSIQSSLVQTISPWNSGEWHKPTSKSGTKLHFRTGKEHVDSGEWTVGGVDINEIGTYHLILPDLPVGNAYVRRSVEVLNVDVRLAEPDDHSYMNIIIWNSTNHNRKSLIPSANQGLPKWSSLITSHAAISIKNETGYPICVYQKKICSDSDRETTIKAVTKVCIGSNEAVSGSSGKDDLMKKVAICVLPGEWLPYGWTDPTVSTKLMAVIGAPFVADRDNLQQFQNLNNFDHERVFSVDTMKVNRIKTVKLKDKIVRSSTVSRPEVLSLQVAMIGNSKTVRVCYASKIKRKSRKSKKDLLEFGDMNYNNILADQTKLLSQRNEEILKRQVTFKCNLRAVSLSVVAERPIRRELYCAHVHKLEFLVRHTPGNNIIENNADEETVSDEFNSSLWIDFRMKDLQVDNYSDSAIYPILVSSVSNKLKTKNALLGKSAQESLQEKQLEESQFIAFSILREFPKEESNPIIKYAALRVLEIEVSIDSSSILLYFSDLHADFLNNVLSFDAGSIDSVYNYIIDFNTYYATTNCYKPINNKLKTVQNNAIISPANLINIERAIQLSQESKIYFENLAIHPLKFRINFIATSFPHDARRNMLDPTFKTMRWYIQKLKLIKSIEDFEIKIKSFLVQNATESISTLSQRITNKTIIELQASLVSIAGSFFGSMSLLGKPAGLYNNIGTGVQDLLYEPYMGIMERSPQAFVLGIGRGTGSLVTNVVGGAVSSTFSIVGAASGGVASGVATSAAALSGNSEEFVRKREERKRNQASEKGLMAGFREGGKSVIGGFATGFKGIASKPIEEGRKGGAIGFMKGLGMGVVGAAVNPILGVTDGISAVADSVSNHLKANDYNSFVRPPRALERSAVDAADLILVPIDNFKACAQQLMYTLAMKKSISDTYVSLRYLGYRDDDIGMKDYYAILFSKKFVRMLTAATEVLWEIQYSDLSHFGIDIGSNSVDLFLNNGNASKTKRFTVKCYDIFSAVGLFEMLSLEKDQMTNGRNIVTVNNVKERVQGKK